MDFGGFNSAENTPPSQSVLDISRPSCKQLAISKLLILLNPSLFPLLSSNTDI